MESLKLKFTSSNNVPVTEARITRQEFDGILKTNNYIDADNVRLFNENQALQAKLDEVMLEYCPDEMTGDQLDVWAEHQVPAGQINEDLL